MRFNCNAAWTLMSVRLTHGISLIISLRASTTSTSSVFAEWSSASESLFCKRARFLSVPCVASRYEPSTRNNANTNTRNDMIIGLHLLEEDARQLHTAGFQPFGEARANAGRAETSEDLALRIDARSLVLENLLHGDRLAVHAGDFRDRR